MALVLSAGQIPTVLAAEGPQNLLANGTFDSGTDGWRVDSTQYGQIAWDSAAKTMECKKVHATAAPDLFADAIEVPGGTKLHLSFAYKTSIPLATSGEKEISIYFFAYSRAFVEGKGSTSFVPAIENKANKK